MTDTATIKRTPGGNTSAYRWHFKVYVNGKVCRNHRILGGYPIEVFSLAHARSIAVTEDNGNDPITHVHLAWNGRTQGVDQHGNVVAA